MLTPEEIENKVERIPFSGCWIWTGPIMKERGYGSSSRYIDGKTVAFFTHRESYNAFVGAIPKGMYVCHRCDIPSCVNPAHLFVGTQQDNISDAVIKGRMWRGRRAMLKTHCCKDHEFTLQNTRWRWRARGNKIWRECLECKRNYVKG